MLQPIPVVINLIKGNSSQWFGRTALGLLGGGKGARDRDATAVAPPGRLALAMTMTMAVSTCRAMRVAIRARHIRFGGSRSGGVELVGMRVVRLVLWHAEVEQGTEENVLGDG